MTATLNAEAPARRLRFPTGGVAAKRPGIAAIVGGSILAVIVLACVIVPFLWSYSPEQIIAPALQAPSVAHPFGTDTVGRDVFLRTLAGGRVDLAVIAIAVSLSAAVGSLLGVLAASSGRWVDAVVMRVVDAIIAFPFMVLVLAIVLLVGTDATVGSLPPGLISLLVAIVVTDWAVYARLARGQTLSLRQRDFVTAARVLGYSSPRIVIRHLLPNVISAVGAYMVTDAILAVVTTASLPFLGAGIQPPAPEWGVIMFGGATVLQTAWWVTILPGSVLALTAIALSLLADALLAKIGGALR
jgi:peptide/nickel transport system permease protein